MGKYQSRRLCEKRAKNRVADKTIRSDVPLDHESVRRAQRESYIEITERLKKDLHTDKS